MRRCWKNLYMKLLCCCLIILVSGCNTEDAPDCFQTVGKMTSREVLLEPFHEIIIYKGIKLFIEQGPEQEVLIESGENLIGEISAEVENGRLSLKNGNGCNLFRDYNGTSVYVTVPNLTGLQNAGNNVVEGRGELRFPEIRLRSYDQQKEPEIYNTGDFRLHLISESIEIIGDNYSNFFLSGSTDYLKINIIEGNGRIEGRDLLAQTIEVHHAGTNKVIVNPQQVLRGEIRSTGDIISVNRPPVVEVESFYTGKLVFE